jgi:hypothetical protein
LFLVSIDIPERPVCNISGNLETALFDTGSLINVVDPPNADKMGIEKYPPAEDFFGFGSLVKGYLVPISIPGVVSFVYLHKYMTDLL